MLTKSPVGTPYSPNDRSDKTLRVRVWDEQRDGLVLGDAESDQREYRERERNHFRSDCDDCFE